MQFNGEGRSNNHYRLAHEIDSGSSRRCSICDDGLLQTDDRTFLSRRSKRSSLLDTHERVIDDYLRFDGRTRAFYPSEDFERRPRTPSNEYLRRNVRCSAHAERSFLGKLVTLEERCEQLEVDNKLFKQQIIHLCKQCNLLEVKNEELRIHANRTAADHQQCQQHIHSLHMSNHQLVHEVDHLKQQCDQVKTENDNLQHQLYSFSRRFQAYDRQLNELWARTSKCTHGVTIDTAPRDITDEGSGRQEPPTPQRVPVEDKAFYVKCRHYYNITKMPLISVSDDIFGDESMSNSTSLVFFVDQELKEFQERLFLNEVCGILNMDSSDIEIAQIREGCIELVAKIFKKFSSEVRKIKIKAVYECLTSKLKKKALGQLKILFMFMGNITGFHKKKEFRQEIILHPRWNRVYGVDHMHWEGAIEDRIDRGPHPYYCPVGWQRFSFYVTDDFREKFKGWSICYHGTKFAHGLSILLSGLAPARDAAHGQGIYASPSINYTAFPRYAEVKEIKTPDERYFFQNGNYLQFVLECRVHPDNIKKIGRETLGVSDAIDVNINNEVIEWVIDTKGKSLMDFNDPNSVIFCTGLMVRVTDNHPGLLPESAWWFASSVFTKFIDNCDMLGVSSAALKEQKQNGLECKILYP